MKLRLVWMWSPYNPSEFILPYRKRIEELKKRYRTTPITMRGIYFELTAADYVYNMKSDDKGLEEARLKMEAEDDGTMRWRFAIGETYVFQELGVTKDNIKDYIDKRMQQFEEEARNPMVTEDGNRPTSFCKIYKEIAAKHFSSGAMARAVAESDGDNSLVESLYAKFRFEELSRELEREAARESRSTSQKTKGFTCPACGFKGELIRRPRANGFVGLSLALLCLIPGIIYFIYFDGYEGVCSNCGSTLVRRMK